MLSTESRRDLAITVGIVLLFSAVMGLLFNPSKPFLAFVWFALGPFTAWIPLITGAGHFADFVVVLPLTVLAIWPAVWAAKASTSASRQHRLTLAGLAWMASTIFYFVVLLIC